MKSVEKLIHLVEFLKFKNVVKQDLRKKRAIIKENKNKFDKYFSNNQFNTYASSSSKHIRMKAKQSKRIQIFRQRAQEVYDEFWKLRFEIVNSKIAREMYKSDFGGIPKRFERNPISDPNWLHYWHISTKNWDKLPPELIYSHRKTLISPV